MLKSSLASPHITTMTTRVGIMYVNLPDFFRRISLILFHLPPAVCRSCPSSSIALSLTSLPIHIGRSIPQCTYLWRQRSSQSCYQDREGRGCVQCRLSGSQVRLSDSYSDLKRGDLLTIGEGALRPHATLKIPSATTLQIGPFRTPPPRSSPGIPCLPAAVVVSLKGMRQRCTKR